MSEAVDRRRCPTCKVASPEAEWGHVDEFAFCEDCMDWHPGRKCPACGATFDVVGPPYAKFIPAKPHIGPLDIMTPDGPVRVRSYLDPD